MEEEKIYVTTDKYKIGQENTNEYVDGDKYLYRISPNTTITEFMNNISTNANISIYNESGEELTNYDELIKTGMTLKISKDEKNIELIVSVLGDINSDGYADISDLVAIRKHIQEIAKISEDEKSLAADINEDNSIDISDLVKVRKHIQEVETL